MGAATPGLGWAGLDLGSRAAVQGGMWAQPEAGAEVPRDRGSSGPGPSPASLPSWTPRIWLLCFSCLAPGGWSPGPLDDTWPPKPSCCLRRRESLWRGPASSPRPSAPSSVRAPSDLPSPGEKRGLGFSSRGEGGTPAVGGGESGRAPTPKPPAGRVGGESGREGARTARARPRPLFRRAGSGAASGPRPPVGAARSRERGRSEARAVGPSRTRPRSPVPARHARLRLQVPGEA